MVECRPSPSEFLNIDRYALTNARIDFRSGNSGPGFLGARNLTDKDHVEQLLPGAGNAGHCAAVLDDSRTWGRCGIRSDLTATDAKGPDGPFRFSELCGESFRGRLRSNF